MSLVHFIIRLFPIMNTVYRMYIFRFKLNPNFLKMMSESEVTRYFADTFFCKVIRQIWLNLSKFFTLAPKNGAKPLALALST